MKIKGAEGMTVAEVKAEVAKGGKFVTFQYCISIVLITFRRGSDIYFIKAGESTLNASIAYTLLSLVAGWWGIPWGPIFTIAALFTNLRGGKDVTNQVMASLQ